VSQRSTTRTKTGQARLSPEVAETGALGVAILAAQSLGILQADAAAASRWVRIRLVREPVPRLVEVYAEVFEAFLRTEQAMLALEPEPVRPG
jgi:sugar (pentulose or hexulose) kinase